MLGEVDVGKEKGGDWSLVLGGRWGVGNGVK